MFSDVVLCECNVSELQSDALKRWPLLRSVVQASTDQLNKGIRIINNTRMCACTP